MKPSIVLQEELHANTRRTRITFSGLIDGRPAAIKCYRKPLFGLFHWLRARHRGNKIREAGGPVPPIVYSGWLPALGCFCFATAFLDGYRSLRAVLREQESTTEQYRIIGLLGRAMANIHQKGIEQSDGNLTNFMLSQGDELAMVDEDDIQVHSSALPSRIAVNNLANVAARLPDQDAVEVLLKAYLGTNHQVPPWDHSRFWGAVAGARRMLETKRAKRNIAPRSYD